MKNTQYYSKLLDLKNEYHQGYCQNTINNRKALLQTYLILDNLITNINTHQNDAIAMAILSQTIYYEVDVMVNDLEPTQSDDFEWNLASNMLLDVVQDMNLARDGAFYDCQESIDIELQVMLTMYDMLVRHYFINDKSFEYETPAHLLEYIEMHDMTVSIDCRYQLLHARQLLSIVQQNNVDIKYIYEDKVYNNDGMKMVILRQLAGCKNPRDIGQMHVVSADYSEYIAEYDSQCLSKTIKFLSNIDEPDCLVIEFTKNNIQEVYTTMSLDNRLYKMIKMNE